MADTNFLDEVETNNFEDLLARIGEYAALMSDAEDAMNVAEQEFKAKAEVFRKLSEEVLPDIMAQANVDELKLSTGRKVSLKVDLKARIPADLFARSECFRWLTDNGADDMIKREVTIPESDDQKISQDLLDILIKSGIVFTTGETVNTQTLQAFFREKLGMKKGALPSLTVEDVPKGFGLFKYRKVTIK